MSNYNDLITQQLNAKIKANGNQEITGPILNGVLKAMVDTLGEGYQYKGIATTATNPPATDARVFYLAPTAGTYTNFGIVLTRASILYYDTAWHFAELGLANDAELALKANLAYVDQQLALKANDSAVVHNSGNETIAGVKTFSNGIKADFSSISGIQSATTLESRLGALEDDKTDIDDTETAMYGQGSDAGRLEALQSWQDNPNAQTMQVGLLNVIEGINIKGKNAVDSGEVFHIKFAQFPDDPTQADLSTLYLYNNPAQLIYVDAIGEVYRIINN